MDRFNQIWVVDAEFQQRPGETPTVHCAVGVEARSKEQRIWRSDEPSTESPFCFDQNSLVVCYAASAEGACFLAQGWPLPCNVLDLHVVFHKLVNNHRPGILTSLLVALEHFGIPHMEAGQKQIMRDLAIRGGPFTRSEMDALAEYCLEDVLVTTKLLQELLPYLDLPRDLLDGRYTFGAVAAMERQGIPLNIPLHAEIKREWPNIRALLRLEAQEEFPVWGPGGEFSQKRFEKVLAREGILWPRTPTGRLCTDGETFKSQGKLHPRLTPLVETQGLLAKMRRWELPVGADGKNRTGLRAFSSRTGRNQPRGEFIFSQAAWVRNLIQPPPWHALVMLDFTQQEFQIAAALSGDEGMLAAYASGDAYLDFAILAGAAPRGATKESHGRVREIYKVAALSIQYGISEYGLGDRLGDYDLARRLIRQHREAYGRYWDWCTHIADKVSLHKATLASPFGWKINCTHASGMNLRAVKNWPVQAAGADILRIAAVAMVESGVPVAAPIHDAFLIHGRADQAEEMAALAQHLMIESSRVVLNGHKCRVDVRRFAPGERFSEPKGEAMFQRILGHLRELRRAKK